MKTDKKIDGRTVYWRLLSYVKPYRGAFVLAMIGNILYGLVDAGFMKLLEPLMNKGFVARDTHFIAWLPFIIIGIFVLRGIACFMSTFFMGWVARRVVMQFRQRLFNHLLSLPATFFDKNSSGELLSRITYNVEQVANASSEALTMIVREGFTAVGLLIVLLSISWQLTSLFFITIPMMMVFFNVASKRLRLVSTNIQDSMESVTHTAEEVIEGYKEVKIFGGQIYERIRFEQATSRNRQQEMKLIVISALNTPIVQLIGSFALAGIIYLATLGSGTAIPSVTPGGFAAMVASMIALLKPIKQLTKVNSTIQRGIAGAASIFDFLDEPAEKDTGTRMIRRAKGYIEFQNISFRYPTREHQYALQNVSFNIEPGQTVAVVGKSGSGKSTLANLLPRFYDVESGVILLDGVPITDFCLTDLRKQFSVVTQHVTLFNDNIANNIAYARPDASFEDIRLAAQSAHILDFIEELPEGFNTFIGENGIRLSGGQRQRLAIARAILKQAPILILDEATSALDTESERAIQSALDELMTRCTTLVIAHRLSTIEHAHKIVVMSHGQVIEAGTHTELLAAGGAYAHLRQLQHGR